MIRILEAATAIMGIVMSFGYYPQIYTMVKNESAKNVSILSYVIFSVGTFVWSLYGLLTGNLMIIVGFIFGWIGSWLVLGLSLYYRSKETEIIVGS